MFNQDHHQEVFFQQLQQRLKILLNNTKLAKQLKRKEIMKDSGNKREEIYK